MPAVFARKLKIIFDINKICGRILWYNELVSSILRIDSINKRKIWNISIYILKFICTDVFKFIYVWNGIERSEGNL